MRPVPGIDGITVCSISFLLLMMKYLTPGALTNALSYVFGPLVGELTDLGYTSRNLRGCPYE